MDHYVLILICFVLVWKLAVISQTPLLCSAHSPLPWSDGFNALWTGSVVCVDLDCWSCPVIFEPANNGWVIVKRINQL